MWQVGVKPTEVFDQDKIPARRRERSRYKVPP